MEYIAFMHDNTDSSATASAWDAFFAMARDSGLFRGGSETALKCLSAVMALATNGCA